MLNRPLPHAAQDRVLNYLARIRELTVDHGRPPGARQITWPILSACLNPGKPLLPNLRRLKIDYFNYSCNEHLVPLLSPSLKKIAIEFRDPQKPPNTVLMILSLAELNGCDLEIFKYTGPLLHRLPESVTQFQNLQHVQLSRPLGAPSEKSPITVVKFLTLLPSLRSFVCDLAAFSPLTDDGDQICYLNLQKIDIKARPQALRELFHRCSFPSVNEVKFQRDTEIPSFEGLASSCPNTRKLSLHFPFDFYGINNDALELKHIASLLSLPIQIFELDTDSHKFTPSDLHTLVESWPNLRSFQIKSDTQLATLPSLAAFSKLPLLSHLDVGLPLSRLLEDFSSVKNPIETHAATQQNKSSLRSLSLTNGYNPTQSSHRATFAEKRLLMGYILLLFPDLERVQISEEYGLSPLSEEELGEFQEILLDLRKERGFESVNLICHS